LGLRWLRAEPGSGPVPETDSWLKFLAAAQHLHNGPELRWFSLLFWTGLFNGVLAFSGLMIWPDNSGVHLLIFLMMFWLAPLILLIWTLVNAWWRKRSPWWRHWLASTDDAVIAAWCAEQSLKAQALFALSGLAWMWFMLLTRQVVFYWSTSLPAASARVDDFLALLTLGILNVPEPLAISASQAGSITGWETALLGYSGYWAFWLTQVVVLWVLVPVVVLALINHWLLRQRLQHWPRWNQALHLRFEQQRPAALHFEAVSAENPRTVDADDTDLDTWTLPSSQPVLAWHRPVGVDLPAGSVILGKGSLAQDEEAISKHTDQVEPVWVIAAQTVPTGDLADLITLSAGSHKEARLVLITTEKPESAQRRPLRQSWQGFVRHQELPVSLNWLGQEANDDQ